MNNEPRIPLIDLIMCLSEALDLVNPILVNHHKQVAYIAFSIGTEFGLSTEEQRNLVFAGALHDVGAFSLKEKIKILKFEVEDPHRHAEFSYMLLRMLEPLSDVADMVRFHHVPWDNGRGSECYGKPVPIGSHILNLADRISVLINKHQPILGQISSISDRIKDDTGKTFKPELVNAFISIAKKEYFWLDIVYGLTGALLPKRITLETIELDDIFNFSRLFSRIIDFRSPFTATHSSGVAVTAEELARLTGMSELECRMMRIAGFLHDLGKLTVPTEILEKPTKLTKDDVDIMRCHTFYTYRLLDSIEDLKVINTWASYHHERLDGRGYPFHLDRDDLSLGSRIMAVADIFTAITEERPYRAGMPEERALSILRKMAETSALDADLVDLLESNYDVIDSLRMDAQAVSEVEREQFAQPPN